MFNRKFLLSTLEKVLTVCIVTFSATLTGTAVASDVAWDVVGWTTFLASLGALAASLMAKGRGDDPNTANFVS